MNAPGPRLAPAGLERRRAERVPMPETGGAVSVVGARLIDVSPYGMMIESPVALTQDTVLQFRLVFEGRKVDVTARVACCMSRGAERHAHGVGLEFLDLPADVRDQLRVILTGYTAPRPPS